MESQMCPRADKLAKLNQYIDGEPRECTSEIAPTIGMSVINNGIIGQTQEFKRRRHIIVRSSKFFSMRSIFILTVQIVL